jgi:hypothetical protein
VLAIFVVDECGAAYLLLDLFREIPDVIATWMKAFNAVRKFMDTGV